MALVCFCYKLGAFSNAARLHLPSQILRHHNLRSQSLEPIRLLNFSLSICYGPPFQHCVSFSTIRPCWCFLSPSLPAWLPDCSSQVEGGGWHWRLVKIYPILLLQVCFIRMKGSWCPAINLLRRRKQMVGAFSTSCRRESNLENEEYALPEPPACHQVNIFYNGHQLTTKESVVNSAWLCFLDVCLSISISCCRLSVLVRTGMGAVLLSCWSKEGWALWQG